MQLEFSEVPEDPLSHSEWLLLWISLIETSPKFIYSTGILDFNFFDLVAPCVAMFKYSISKKWIPLWIWKCVVSFVYTIHVFESNVSLWRTSHCIICNMLISTVWHCLQVCVNDCRFFLNFWFLKSYWNVNKSLAFVIRNI